MWTVHSDCVAAKTAPAGAALDAAGRVCDASVWLCNVLSVASSDAAGCLCDAVCLHATRYRYYPLAVAAASAAALDAAVRVCVRGYAAGDHHGMIPSGT